MRNIVMLGEWLDLMTLEGFSSTNSVIPLF